MEPEVVSVLRTHRHQLLDRLQPVPVMDLLLSSGTLSQGQHQRIRNLPTREAACDRLISDLEKAGVSGYRHFLEALQETGQDELVSKLPDVTEISHTAEAQSSESASVAAQHLHVRIIRRNLTALKENIDIKYSGLYDKLVEKYVLSRTECRKIQKSSPSPMEQIGNLLEVVETKSTWEFAKFIDALRETNQQPVVDMYLQGGYGIEEHLRGIRGKLALWYQRNLSRYPIYRFTNNPKMADLRRLYTPTQFVDLTDWPPLPTGEPYEDYSRLFSKGSGSVPRVLLLGTPGMGKSMLSWKLALDWADAQQSESSESASSTNEHLKKELVLFLDLSRVRKPCTLVQIFHEQFSITKEDAQNLVDYLSIHSGNILFVLDAWDEYEPSFCEDLTQIANGTLCKNSTLLITSRIRDQTLMPENIDKVCQTNGFSVKHAKSFMKKVLEFAGTSQKCEHLIESITSSRLWDIFCVPYMINQMCILQYDNVGLKDNVTDLYCEIVKSKIYYENLKKEGKAVGACVKEPLANYEQQLTCLGKIALLGLAKANTQTVFDLGDFEAESKTIMNLGLCHRIEADTNLRGASLFTYGHKSIQEFLAAIYVVQCKSGREVFFEYLKSIKEVYDSQLLVKFMCGLSSDVAKIVIEKVQELERQKVITAAECPGFSSTGWSYKNPTTAQKAYLHDSPVDAVEPFLIGCCAEARNLHCCFPFKLSDLRLQVEITPNLNFSLVDQVLLENLLKNGVIKFGRSNSFQISDLLASQGNVKGIKNIFFIPKEVRDIFVKHSEFDKESMSVFTKNISSLPEIEAFTMMSFKCPSEDMKILLKHLKTRVSMKKWYQKEPDVTGCENDLCECISRLVNLTELRLRSLTLSEHYQVALCQAISRLHLLLQLDLECTDLSGAGGALSRCLKSLTKLRFLHLYDSPLTVEQTRQVLSCLPASCPGLKYLSMSFHSIKQSFCELIYCISALQFIEGLYFLECDLPTRDIVSLFGCLQPNMKILVCTGIPINEEISRIIPLLSKVPQLQYLWISSPGSPAASKEIDRLRVALRASKKKEQPLAMCQNPLLIVGEEEYKNHAVEFHKAVRALSARIRQESPSSKFSASSMCLAVGLFLCAFIFLFAIFQIYAFKLA